MNYIITSILPDTQLAPGFLDALKVCANYHKARLLIIPQAYKNPTSRMEYSSQKKDEWYPLEAHEYLCSEYIEDFNGNLKIYAGMRVAATSSDPLSAIMSAESGLSVLGHAKLYLKCSPTYGKWPGVKITTGSISKRNYSNTVAGHRSAAQHATKALLIVGLSESQFEFRHLSFKSNQILDLSGRFDKNGRSPPSPGDVCVMQLGDVHANSIATNDLAALSKLIRRVRPKTLLCGDLIDWQRYSHHSKNLLKKRDLPGPRSEAAAVARFMNVVPAETQVIFQESNHHDHPTLWIEAWEKPQSLRETSDFHEFLGYWLAAERNKTTLFEEWMRAKLTNLPELKFVSCQRPFKSHKGRTWLHGHEGMRGMTPSALAKAPFSTVSGHGHTPEIRDHAYRVGSLMRPEAALYVKGWHSWHIAHAIEYSNGAMQLLFQL
jgi:predicted MPP superfamily phosphohydrolase